VRIYRNELLLKASWSGGFREVICVFFPKLIAFSKLHLDRVIVFSVNRDNMITEVAFVADGLITYVLYVSFSHLTSSPCCTWHRPHEDVQWSSESVCLSSLGGTCSVFCEVLKKFMDLKVLSVIKNTDYSNSRTCKNTDKISEKLRDFPRCSFARLLGVYVVRNKILTRILWKTIKVLENVAA